MNSIKLNYFTGMQYPMCAISKAKYLTRSGWVNFKNQSDFETPFQIHRENGHVMLLVSFILMIIIFIALVNKRRKIRYLLNFFFK